MSDLPRTDSRVRAMRWLNGVTAVLLTAAAALWLVIALPGNRVSTDTVTAKTANAAPGAPSADVPSLALESGSAASDSLVDVVVRNNLFSATRRAPSARFVAPAEVSGASTAAPSDSVGRVNAAASDDASFPRLSGIVTASGDARALLQMAASDGAPQLYRVGDVHAGVRVVRIAPDLVVLATRAGTRILRLSSHAPPDSLENLL
jgi:hypothetical protein